MLPHSPPPPFSTPPIKDTVWHIYHTARLTKWGVGTPFRFYSIVDFGLGKPIFKPIGRLGSLARGFGSPLMMLGPSWSMTARP